MPVSKHRRIQVEHEKLRPFIYHGLDLTVQGSHAIGDCPFCGREGKLSISVDTGLWRCFVCASGSENGGGNALIFLRLLHDISLESTPKMQEESLIAMAKDRHLCDPSTLSSWGVCISCIDGAWLVPAYTHEGKLYQLYRRTRILEKNEWVWRLLPTPGLWQEGKVHGIHLPAGDFDRLRPKIDVCEGPWDGMVMWETLETSESNIIAVPGCNQWRDEWTEMCRGKHVTLWYDSDHPRVEHGKMFRAGFDGMYRVSRKLSGIAASVRWIRWGREGWDESRPSGWDVRDVLSQQDTITARRPLMNELMNRVEPAPSDWFLPLPSSNGVSHVVESKQCESWIVCEDTWKEAVEWRRDIADALAVLLAVCASTKQAGNQLFMDLIGSPGSLKTTLCRGLLVSSHCIHLENVTKILSGFKKPGDGDKDCSFLARANGKTWITCEFDTLGSSPQYHELMGKIRRIFDGETSTTYGNSDIDRIYTALRTPWIRAGTHKMMDHDQSQLGDRFLRFIISDPNEAEKRSIARSALRSELSAMVETSNNTAGSIFDAKTRLAHAMTGGYVDWLRANAEDKLAVIDVSTFAEDRCIDLAELSADLRARPNEDKKHKETYNVKELPTRLSRQYIRLATCLAVVFNKTTVDNDVLRILRKVALDTAHGHSLNMVKWLCSRNPKADGETYQESCGLMEGMLQVWTGMSKERLTNYLMFLSNIGVLEYRRQHRPSWYLTERVYELWCRIRS